MANITTNHAITYTNSKHKIENNIVIGHYWNKNNVKRTSVDHAFGSC